LSVASQLMLPSTTSVSFDGSSDRRALRASPTRRSSDLAATSASARSPSAACSSAPSARPTRVTWSSALGSRRTPSTSMAARGGGQCAGETGRTSACGTVVGAIAASCGCRAGIAKAWRVCRYVGPGEGRRRRARAGPHPALRATFSRFAGEGLIGTLLPKAGEEALLPFTGEGARRADEGARAQRSVLLLLPGKGKSSSLRSRPHPALRATFSRFAGEGLIPNLAARVGKEALLPLRRRRADPEPCG